MRHDTLAPPSTAVHSVSPTVVPPPPRTGHRQRHPARARHAVHTPSMTHEARRYEHVHVHDHDLMTRPIDVCDCRVQVGSASSCPASVQLEYSTVNIRFSIYHAPCTMAIRFVLGFSFYCFLALAVTLLHWYCAARRECSNFVDATVKRLSPALYCTNPECS